jgi:malonyl-CoA decarboxylase
MAADLSSTLPSDSAEPLNYRTDNPSLVSRERSRGACDALGWCDELLSSRGDVPGNEAGRNLLASYQSFDEGTRAAFFDGLSTRIAVDPSGVRRAAEAYLRNPGNETLQALQQASDAPLRELFLRLNAAPGATAWLVRMREHLHNHPEWATIERDLTHVLGLLFHRSMLDFQQIDLETPTLVLERLIESEAVHPINDWREMARRLEADRRCYAFFHPGWPQEPLIFTEVALTRGIGSAMRPILDPESPVADPRACDTAMFYSISNCQPGLRGFSFGNWLLTRVIQQLRAEMPWLRRFATISPIPGFRSWLSASGSRNGSQDELLALCAHYLLRVKQGGEPADPVARFHLGNGARLHRLNPSSDPSPEGIRRSGGLTVNYIYRLNELERNAATYRRTHEVIAVPAVARQASLALPLLSNPPLVA